MELAKKCIGQREFDAAAEHVRQAIAADASKAEGLNLIGAILELQGDRSAALKNYRAAIALDPTYKPAMANLDRAASWPRSGGIELEERNQAEDKEQGEKA